MVIYRETANCDDNPVASKKILITAEDVRQYIYCPRKSFFRHVRSIYPKTPYKVERGVEIHDARARYQPTAREGEPEITRHYDVPLEDPTLGLLAILDYFEEVAGEVYPVELKTGPLEVHTPPPHHVAQLAVQAMLLEKYFNQPVTRGRVIYVDCNNKRFDIPITLDDKERALAAADHIRHMVETEEMPKPTPDIGKCDPCEMWNYCLHS